MLLEHDATPRPTASPLMSDLELVGRLAFEQEAVRTALAEAKDALEPNRSAGVAIARRQGRISLGGALMVLRRHL